MPTHSNKKNRRLSKQEQKRKDALPSMDVPPSRKAAARRQRERLRESQCGSSSSTCSASCCPSRCYSYNSHSESSCSSRLSSTSSLANMDMRAWINGTTLDDLILPGEEVSSCVQEEEEDTFALFDIPSTVGTGNMDASTLDRRLTTTTCNAPSTPNTDLADIFDRAVTLTSRSNAAHLPLGDAPLVESPLSTSSLHDDREETSNDQYDNGGLTFYEELAKLGHALGLSDAPSSQEEGWPKNSEEEKEEIESLDMEDRAIFQSFYC